MEDVALVGLTGALLLAVANGWARWLWGAFLVCLVAAHVIWGEVLVFFGQVPGYEALVAGLNKTFARGAAQGTAFVGATLFLLVFAIALLGAGRLVRRSRRAWSSPRRLLFAGALGALATWLPIPIHRRSTAGNPSFSLAAVLRQHLESEPEGSIAALPPRRDPISVRELAPDSPRREYLNARFPLAHRPLVRSPSAARLPAGVRPNFVFLLLEGVRAEEVGVYGGNPPHLTPNLDRLAHQGILVERAYSPGMHTPDAELALWYGLLPHPRASLMTSHPHTKLAGLPDILRAAGWRSFLWIHNGDQTFYRRDRFYLPRGFRMVDGRDFPRTDARTNWGYSDRALARRAVDALDRAEEPFAALTLTVTNHHPFKVPADAQTTFAGLPPPTGDFRPFLAWGQGIGRYAVPMLQTVHYTDEAIGDFFRLAQKRPWYSRTVFVISGDHGLSIVPLHRSISTLAALTELRHRVPMILFSPMLRPARIPGPASQADVPETLLALADISLVRAGAGRDLLDPIPHDTNRRIVTWSAEGRVVSVVGKTRTYQASVDGDVASAAQPVRFSEELFFDPSGDPDGKQNLLAREPHDAEVARRLAEIYLEAYAWLLLSGRSGVSEQVVSAPVGRKGDGI